MADDQPAPTGPDLAPGVALADLPDGGKLLGHLGDEQVLLLRRGGEVFAIGASCTHYSGPLAEGLVVGDMIRCPWHHAGFDFRTGEALRAPALSPLPCWSVEQREGKVFVRGKRNPREARQQGCGQGAGEDRHHRRRGRGLRRGGAAAPGAIPGQHRHAEPGGCRTGRPAQSLQGLSCRQCARGMGAAAPRQLLRRERHRAAPRRQGDRHRQARPRRRARRRHQARLRPAAAGDRRRAGAPLLPRGRSAPCPCPALFGRQPRHHRRREAGQARGGDRRQLHRARGRGGAAPPQDRGPCGGAGEAADGTRAGTTDGRFRPRPA